MSQPVSASPAAKPSLLPDAAERVRRRRMRTLKDRLSRYGITTAGLAVVVALALIFVYLFSEVLPMFRGAAIEPAQQYELSTGPVEHLVLERYEEIAAVFGRDGQVHFLNADDGAALARYPVPVPASASASALGVSELATGLVAYGFDNGQMSLVRHAYALSYPNDQRLITPSLEYPLGEQPVTLDSEGQGLSVVAVQQTPSGVLLAAVTEDQRLLLGVFNTRTHMFTGEVQVARDVYALPALPVGVRATALLVDRTARHLIVADDAAQLHYYDISTPAQARLTETVDTGRGKVTAMAFLVGGISVITGTDEGKITQWYVVRDEHNRYHLRPVRDFKSLPAAVTRIAPEYTRKGFLAADRNGSLGIYYGTSARTLLTESLSDQAIAQLAVSPINGRLLALDANNRLQVVELWNKHPDISFSALWERVWYEGRERPEYIWQASSGQDDFEAKMSLVPLSVGTLKAAFYAMLLAMPLGVMGAIYTAYFMPPKQRQLVKPTIEIMEALPTVILGFLAGLWLAPFIENHLPAIFSILVLLPVMMLAVAFAWSRLPAFIRHRAPEGYEALILVLPILLTGWACVAASPYVEVLFFNGSMRQWFTDNGITYDQRNALVVGLAMGFAVIPTIFSIAEDAVFNVPKHLTQGSLALGATRWQTVVGVVLPTASPGIFSAMMMGFGRAVGETMIVLMATGNSPIVNFNIFEGMRTLSANIAVELPETAVNSSHFRVLFLAALVLLALTFVVNTIAEVVRQRLRKRYSSL